MIDLHIKTALSTGEMSVFRLLKTLKKADISYFSIVDKNHAHAYNLFDVQEYPNLITGTAINTYYQGRPIDLLGYDIDTDIINEWFENNFTPKQVDWIERDKEKRILKILALKSYKLEGNYKRYDKVGIVSKQIFTELIESYPDFIYKNERDFRLYGLNNPESEYYLDQSRYLPNIDEVINLIKKAGGKAFLAHPFEYRCDVGDLLQMVLDKKLDGVEVFHSSISRINSLKLVEFCEVSNLLASLGSGFIGHDYLIPLGVHLDEEILKKPCFKWIYNR